MDPCLAFCHLIKRASCISEKHLVDALSDMNLNLSQSMLLIHIAEEEGKSMSDLGKALCCHKSNITQLVDGLMEQGLITRCACGEDRRVQCIELTEKGKETMDKLHKILGQHAHKCIEVLDEKESVQLTALLTKYVEKNTERV